MAATTGFAVGSMRNSLERSRWGSLEGYKCRGESEGERDRIVRGR